MPASPSELASELALGLHHERPADLAGMKRAMESRGLLCEAFRDATPEELIARLEGNSLWVAHLKTTDRSGHFCVVARHPKSASIAMINPGVSQQWLNASEAAARLKGSFTGWCMRVGRASQPEAPFDLDSGRAQITFGVINGAQGLLVVRVPVTHSGPEPLTIESYTGSCGCLSSVVAQDAGASIEPRRTSVLVFGFERRGLGVGAVQTEVAVQFAGPTRREVTFDFSGALRPDGAPLAWFPEKVDLGIITPARAQDAALAVRFLLCGSTSVAAGECSPGLTVSEPVLTKLDAGPDGRERALCTFTMRLTDPKPGPLKESVTFQSSCDSLGKIVIPVRGEYRP